MSETTKEAWLPLASSPNSFNKLAACLGVDTDRLSFQDVVCLDIDYLKHLPPCHALILTYPTIPSCEELLRSTFPDDAASSTESNVHFFRQLIGGTCGTIAVIHALANGSTIKDCTFIPKFVPDKNCLLCQLCTDGTTTAERSNQLVKSSQVRAAHEHCAVETTTTKPGTRGEKQGRHFICLVEHDGSLMLLDGRRERPIKYGDVSSSGGFIETAASFISDVIAVAGDAMASSFSVVALVEHEN